MMRLAAMSFWASVTLLSAGVVAHSPSTIKFALAQWRLCLRGMEGSFRPVMNQLLRQMGFPDDDDPFEYFTDENK